MKYNNSMWTCPTCGRIFGKTKQPHSCQIVPLEKHFQNKAKAKELFEALRKAINKDIGPCKIISLPCCIHLFGTHDFLAVLPKKESLEIRFTLNRKLNTSRLKQSVPISNNAVKNCIDISTKDEVDKELMVWVKESYSLK